MLGREDIVMLRRRLQASNEIAASALRLIIYLVIRSASPTALLALISAVISQTLTLGGQFETK